MLHVTQPEPGIVHLTGALTIHTATDLYQQLRSLPFGEDAVQPLLFVMESITEIDLSGIQTLLAFKQSRPKNSVQCSVSDEIREHCRLCGLDKYLI